MAVKLDLDDERATLLWCRGARAIKGFREACSEQNIAAMGRYGGYMEEVLNQLSEAAPEELRPDGNETDKP